MSTACAYEDTTVVNGITYCYVATELALVKNSDCATPPCESGYSDPVIAVISSSLVPNPPTGLISSVVNKQVQLNWTPPIAQAGVTVNSFSVWRGTKPSLPSPMRIATVTSISYTDSKCKFTCYYEIKANDTVSGSQVVTAPSNIVKAKVQ